MRWIMKVWPGATIGPPCACASDGCALRTTVAGAVSLSLAGGCMSRQEELVAAGLEIPAGYSIASYDERPDLDSAIDDLLAATWAPFMNEDEVANAHFRKAYAHWPRFQTLLIDSAGTLVSVGNAMPLPWDGTDDDLPAGWREQILRSAEALERGLPVDTLGAMQIAMRGDVRGAGLSGAMVGAMRAGAKAAGYRAVIADVRPTWKERYPLIPIERHAAWTREDGLPFDPWMRLHARLGARVVRASPQALIVRGSVADWESWTGMDFPESGSYVVPRATRPIEIDRERDEGVYYDENVWIVHDVD